MEVVRGSDFRLRLGAGGSSPDILAIEGLRVTATEIVNSPVDVTNMASGGWRTLLSGGGARQVRVTAEGLFLAGAADQRLRQLALKGKAATFELTMESRRSVSGSFVLERLAYSAGHDDEVVFEISMVSSGPVVLLTS